jgi:hypothetical protein
VYAPPVSPVNLYDPSAPVMVIKLDPPVNATTVFPEAAAGRIVPEMLHVEGPGAGGGIGSGVGTVLFGALLVAPPPQPATAAINSVVTRMAIFWLAVSPRILPGIRGSPWKMRTLCRNTTFTVQFRNAVRSLAVSLRSAT